jgi:SAM-dependent methyltransferase
MGVLEGVEAGWRARFRTAGADSDYQPFPDVERRNLWQERVEVPALVNALGLPQGGRVLEVGCGRGIALPVLAARLRPARLVGLDVDEALLEQAAARLRERRCEAELVAGDVRDLPFPDSSFDLVVDFGTCYHVAGPGRALREVSRVLAEGGRFVHETRLSQLLSHPVRARGNRLPWHLAPALRAWRRALLWAARTKARLAAILLALAHTIAVPVAQAAEPPGAGPTRLFFAPTARALPRGQGSVGLTEIAFPWAEAGIVDRVSILGLVVPPLGDLSSGGGVVAPRIQLVRHARFQAAAGVIQAIGEQAGGVGYGVVTLGSASTALTAGYGYAYGQGVDSGGSRGVVLVGVEKAVHRSLRLVVEGWIGGQAMGLPDRTFIAGVRLSRGRWSVDLAAVVPVYETGAGTPAPLLTVARAF